MRNSWINSLFAQISDIFLFCIQGTDHLNVSKYLHSRREDQPLSSRKARESLFNSPFYKPPIINLMMKFPPTNYVRRQVIRTCRGGGRTTACKHYGPSKYLPPVTTASSAVKTIITRGEFGVLILIYDEKGTQSLLCFLGKG